MCRLSIKRHNVPFILSMELFFLMLTSANYAQTPVPSPTCNPGSILAEMVSSVGMRYALGTTFTLTLRLLEGDFPTTPALIRWSGSAIDDFIGNISEEFVIHDQSLNQIDFLVRVSGPGIRPECPIWLTSARIDMLREGAPTPTPFPSPSPTQRVCHPPCKCTPTPDVSCSELIVYPKTGTRDAPTSFILEHIGVAFLGMEEISTGNDVPVTQIGEKQFLVQNLKPNRGYVWYLLKFFDGCGDPITCFPSFRTSPEPSHPWGWLLSQKIDSYSSSFEPLPRPH